MPDNSRYWTRRDELSEKAHSHIKEMERLYADEIADAVRNTEIYGPDGRYGNETEIELKAADTVSAAAEEYRKAELSLKDKFPIAVLNFASYNNPGGKFTEGSCAQEECLCHNSFLYNVLRELTEYYGYNNKNKNRALYTDRAAYTPKVRFMTDDGECFHADVITCAAPNYSAARKYQNVSPAENTEALRSRIRFVLDTASRHNVKTLILGAYGCGVFGQDPAEVSDIFIEYIKNEYRGYFDKVVFAIPDSTSANYLAFQKTIREAGQQ